MWQATHVPSSSVIINSSQPLGRESSEEAKYKLMYRRLDDSKAMAIRAFWNADCRRQLEYSDLFDSTLSVDDIGVLLRR